MKVRELSIPDAYEVSTDVFPDERGLFLNPFRADVLAEAIGHPLAVAQTNHSVSRAGVVRGIHFALLPPGQAKYVYCPRGAALDVVVDIRIGSPAYGRHDVVRLDDRDFRAVYLAEGHRRAHPGRRRGAGAPADVRGVPGVLRRPARLI